MVTTLLNRGMHSRQRVAVATFYIYILTVFMFTLNLISGNSINKLIKLQVFREYEPESYLNLLKKTQCYFSSVLSITFKFS